MGPSRVKESKGKTRSLNPKDFQFLNMSDTISIKQPGQINGQAFSIEDLNSCDVTIMDVTGSVTVDKTNNSRITFGPVKGAFILRDCHNCHITVACKQFRVVNSTNCIIRLYCMTDSPVVESSSNLVFLPYNIYYPELASQVKTAKLDTKVNYWNQISDSTPDNSQNTQPHFIVGDKYSTTIHNITNTNTKSKKNSPKHIFPMPQSTETTDFEEWNVYPTKTSPLPVYTEFMVNPPEEEIIELEPEPEPSANIEPVSSPNTDHEDSHDFNNSVSDDDYVNFYEEHDDDDDSLFDQQRTVRISVCYDTPYGVDTEPFHPAPSSTEPILESPSNSDNSNPESQIATENTTEHIPESTTPSQTTVEDVVSIVSTKSPSESYDLDSDNDMLVVDYDYDDEDEEIQTRPCVVSFCGTEEWEGFSNVTSINEPSVVIVTSADYSESESKPTLAVVDVLGGEAGVEDVSHPVVSIPFDDDHPAIDNSNPDTPTSSDVDTSSEIDSSTSTSTSSPENSLNTDLANFTGLPSADVDPEMVVAEMSIEDWNDWDSLLEDNSRERADTVNLTETSSSVQQDPRIMLLKQKNLYNPTRRLMKSPLNGKSDSDSDANSVLRPSLFELELEEQRLKNEVEAEDKMKETISKRQTTLKRRLHDVSVICSITCLDDYIRVELMDIEAERLYNQKRRELEKDLPIEDICVDEDSNVDWEGLTDTRNAALTQHSISLAQRNAQDPTHLDLWDMTSEKLLALNPRPTVIRKDLRSISFVKSCMYAITGSPKFSGANSDGQDAVLIAAIIPYDLEEQSHWIALKSSYKNITGAEAEKVGNHWINVGFQHANPVSDMRGSGIWGVFQIMFMSENYTAFAKELFELSKDKTFPFPMMVTCINISGLIIQWVRTPQAVLYHQKHSKRFPDVAAMCNHVYVACMYKFYTLWSSRIYTVRQFNQVRIDLQKALHKDVSGLVRAFDATYNNVK